jgi:hypothetical protein
MTPDIRPGYRVRLPNGNGGIILSVDFGDANYTLAVELDELQDGLRLVKLEGRIIDLVIPHNA